MNLSVTSLLISFPLVLQVQNPWDSESHFLRSTRSLPILLRIPLFPFPRRRSRRFGRDLSRSVLQVRFLQDGEDCWDQGGCGHGLGSLKKYISLRERFAQAVTG